MSAQLVVNTRDGVCWTRRTVTSGGIALYAPESVKTCPRFVMATIEELAEHGIVGSADALPMPVGPEPQPRTLLDRARDALNARMAKDDLRLVLENVIGYAAWLEAERHSTNESLSEAAETLRANRDRITELEARLAEREQPADTYPPALPWARLMDAEDLADFLDELAASAITHASVEVALSEVESTCGRWRVIAEAQHAHNTAPGPDAKDRVVAYRNTDRPGVLLCRTHGDGWAGLTPLTSDDLPDGGTCTYGDPAAGKDHACGRDVLIGGA